MKHCTSDSSVKLVKIAAFPSPLRCTFRSPSGILGQRRARDITNETIVGIGTENPALQRFDPEVFAELVAGMAQVAGVLDRFVAQQERTLA
jgi:hypothetical protein